MLRDTPVLNGLVSENMKAKDSSNTILEKDFPGGDINIAGANSLSSLSSRPRSGKHCVVRHRKSCSSSVALGCLKLNT